MLLERLSEYADQIQMPPPMYQWRAVRYVIQLSGSGQFLGMIDRATPKEKNGSDWLIPDRKRTVSIRPKLLADTAGYVFGIAREGADAERAQLTRAAFLEMTRRCAQVTGESAVQAVVTYLEGLEGGVPALPDGFDPGATISFEVGEVARIRPTDLLSVQKFWAQEAAAAAADDETQVMQCLVCGQMRSCVERLAIPIKGIPGSTMGMALISANEDAFLSYGLKASLIAPTCEECGLRFGYALNALLDDERTHIGEGDNRYIFWAREPAPFSVATLLSQANESEVREFLMAAWRAKPAATTLDVAPFYAAMLSGANARVIVRDWLETTLGEAQRHLQRYFAWQRLLDTNGQWRWFTLYALTHATVNSKSSQEKAAPQVGRALLRLALHGDPLPDWLLYQAVRRTRAEQRVTATHAALIKMVLLSQAEMKNSAGGMDGRSMNDVNNVNDVNDVNDMAELDVTNRDAAYLCGRLLAELEATQRAALGDISSTVVDRYFGTASSAPASVFGRLLRGAQPHLAKLRKEKRGAFYRIDERLQDIMRDLTSFPAMLTLKQQGLFALGYYHQKAADLQAARERQRAKGQSVSAITETTVENDGD